MTKTIRYNTHNTIHVKERKRDTLFIHTLQKSLLQHHQQSNITRQVASN